MERDVLFLLRPDFRDAAQGEQPFFCPDSALVEGLLSFYPQLRQQLDVRYVDFPRPRPAIVALLGEQHQNCPVLVVASLDAGAEDLVEHSAETGRGFCTGGRPIARYLHLRAGIGDLHP